MRVASEWSAHRYAVGAALLLRTLATFQGWGRDGEGALVTTLSMISSRLPAPQALKQSTCSTHRERGGRAGHDGDGVGVALGCGGAAGVAAATRRGR